jgi:putative membrane protein
MNRNLMIISALALLAACNKPHNATGASADTQPVPSSAATVENVPPSGMPEANPAATLNTPVNDGGAPGFVTKAAVSDMFEIQSSKIALQRSNNKDIKDFARMMIHDHTESTAALKAAIAASGQTSAPPDALPDDKKAALDSLTTVAAGDFDKKYMDAQLDGHKQALDLMARYANDGDVPQIKAFAAKTGPVVQHHLDMAKQIRAGLS